MSYNISRTLFYEYHKSDPDLINASIEEYRNYKSDPEFADKTLEQYRRSKAVLLAKQSMTTQESISEDNRNLDEKNQTESEYENEIDRTQETKDAVKIDNVIEQEIKNEIENINEIQNKSENESDNESVLFDDSLEQKRFEQSLEQLQQWKIEDEPDKYDLQDDTIKKKAKSKFRIPKFSSKAKFSNTKSRYMDVHKKKKTSKFCPENNLVKRECW